MNEPRKQRRLAAILAADIAGYSRLMEADEAATLSAMGVVWAEHFNPTVAAHHGRVVKMMGDGALVEFASAVEAVECALAIQQAMASLKQSRRGREPLEFRIGVNLGDIVIDGDDIFGDGVNLAARLEGQAPTGGVLVSDSVHAQIKGKVGVHFDDAGTLTLKNIETPVRAWRWPGEETSSYGSTPQAQASPAARNVPSIAVLPFTSMSGDPEQEFFADGLVEDIITTLSKLAGLRVIARNSTFVYKGQAVDIRTVARELGVQYVLEGSVRRGGERVRITAQLVDASGAHVWAERYDRAIDDIFAVQDEITLVLATEMQVRLTEGEQARLRYTTTGSVEAWSLWVQGLFYYRQAITKENMGAALSCWTKALALDPASSSLNAMIGLVHYADARFGWWEDRETAHGKAMSYAERALDLDPENPDANVIAGLALLQAGRHDEAAVKARRAVQLAPGSADAASFGCFILAFAGYPDEAVTHGERALTLSPNYPASYLGQLGNAYRLANRAEEAVTTFKGYHARVPGFGLVDLVLVYQQSGQPEEAVRRAKELLAIRKDFTVARWASTQYRADQEGLQADVAALLAAGLPME